MTEQWAIAVFRGMTFSGSPFRIKSAAASPTSSPAVRYWNTARQRYHRLSARYSRARVSLPTQAARPGPHNRGKPRLLDLERRIPARDRFAPDSPLGGTGFEPSVPLFERVLSALPNGDAGPIGWMGSLSPGRLARRRSLRADPFSTAVSLTAGPIDAMGRAARMATSSLHLTM